MKRRFIGQAFEACDTRPQSHHSETELVIRIHPIMPTESSNPEEITDSRRAAIEDTIHTISLDEVKALGEELFPILDHPWREAYFKFIAENTNGTFYHAVTDDRIHIVYGRPAEKGMWFVQGSGRGPLGDKGLKILKEIVEKA